VAEETMARFVTLISWMGLVAIGLGELLLARSEGYL
jgi:hypothetical protein